MKPIVAIVSLLLCAVRVDAAIYHVDFADGDDRADGATPASAWKHSPGDPRAEGGPAAVRLQPGDLVRFKGGVHYRGEVRLNDVRGAAGKPITLDGNVDGTYGEGPAILDGARVIDDWKPVASTGQVGGNPKWRDIVYADLEVDLTSNFTQDRFILHRDGQEDRQAPWQRLFLVDGETRVLPVAQEPKPSDPFYPDLPGDFFESPVRLGSSYPHRIHYPEGSRGNRSLPLLAITYGGAAPVIEPFDGGEVAVDLAGPATIAAIGVTLFRPKSNEAPEEVAFYADGKEVLVARVDPGEEAMQRFPLPQPVEARTITFQLRHSSTERRWTKLQQLAAFTPGGDNILKHPVTTRLEDPERLTRPEPGWYDGMFVGVHGGNNHVYFARVRGYDPDAHRLELPHFSATTYEETRYALYNSPKFIDRPGEWCLEPLEGGRTRVYFMPEGDGSGAPEGIGYPVLQTALTIDGPSRHLEVRGFLMQRYAGGQGGVAVNGRGGERPSHIRIADCEVRFVSGQSGISLNHADRLTVENCHVHHCPGWTVGIYVNRVNGFSLLGTRIDYNSGSGIRHYEAKQGVLKDNVVINHHGMHSSGLNFYEGCRNILFEGNHVQNVIAINRSAEDLTFRNNVVDSLGSNAFSVAMWQSGQVGGRHLRNITFEKNTFVNTSSGVDWATAIFVQGGASAPEGLVVRHNILSRLRPPFPGTVADNIFLQETPAAVAGGGSRTVADPALLFRDPDKGDYRRRPGGPMPEAGADVPPPSDVGGVDADGNRARRDLPDDLEVLARRFEARVRGEQEDLQFRLSTVRDPDLRQDPVAGIRRRETGWHPPGFEDLRVDEFSVVDVRARHGADQLTPLLAALLGPGRPPFFLHTIRGIKDAGSREEGRQVVRELLAELDGGRPHAFLVTVAGNCYGDYRHAVLYVRSAQDPAVFLRYYFDLVHEI